MIDKSLLGIGLIFGAIAIDFFLNKDKPKSKPDTDNGNTLTDKETSSNTQDDMENSNSKE
jgi:hypothetical protein